MKDKYDTSEVFPDGTPKNTDTETPFLNTLNRMAGSLFKTNDALEKIREEMKVVRWGLEQLREEFTKRGEI